MEPLFVAHFDDLKSIEKREKAAHQILRAIHRPANRNLAENVLKERREYALKRCTRGVCSGNGVARQGFGGVLASIIAQEAGDVDVREVLKMKDTFTTLGLSDAQLQLGVFFLCSAIVNAGVFDQRLPAERFFPSADSSKETADNGRDVARRADLARDAFALDVAHLLHTVASSPKITSYAKEPCSRLILQLLLQTSAKERLRNGQLSPEDPPPTQGSAAEKEQLRLFRCAQTFSSFLLMRFLTGNGRAYSSGKLAETLSGSGATKILPKDVLHALGNCAQAWGIVCALANKDSSSFKEILSLLDENDSNSCFAKLVQAFTTQGVKTGKHNFSDYNPWFLREFFRSFFATCKAGESCEELVEALSSALCPETAEKAEKESENIDGAGAGNPGKQAAKLTSSDHIVMKSVNALLNLLSAAVSVNNTNDDSDDAICPTANTALFAKLLPAVLGSGLFQTYLAMLRRGHGKSVPAKTVLQAKQKILDSIRTMVQNTNEKSRESVLKASFSALKSSVKQASKSVSLKDNAAELMVNSSIRELRKIFLQKFSERHLLEVILPEAMEGRDVETILAVGSRREGFRSVNFAVVAFVFGMMVREQGGELGLKAVVAEVEKTPRLDAAPAQAAVKAAFATDGKTDAGRTVLPAYWAQQLFSLLRDLGAATSTAKTSAEHENTTADYVDFAWRLAKRMTPAAKVAPSSDKSPTTTMDPDLEAALNDMLTSAPGETIFSSDRTLKQLLASLDLVRLVGSEKDAVVANDTLEPLLVGLAEVESCVGPAGADVLPEKSKKKKKSKKLESSPPPAETAARTQALLKTVLCENLPIVFAETAGFVKESAETAWRSSCAALLQEEFLLSSPEEAAANPNLVEFDEQALAESGIRLLSSAEVSGSRAIQLILGLGNALVPEKEQREEAEMDVDDGSPMDGEDAGEGGEQSSDAEREGGEKNVGSADQLRVAQHEADKLAARNQFEDIELEDEGKIFDILTTDEANEEASALEKAFFGGAKTKPENKREMERKTREAAMLKMVKYLTLIKIFIREAEKLKPKIGPIGRKLLAEMLLQLTNALVVSEKLLQHTKGSKGQLSDLTKHYPTKLAECIKTLAHVVAAKTDAGAPPSHGDVSVKVAAEMTAICQSQNRNMFTLFEAVGNAVISLGTPSSGGTPSTSCKQAITDAVSSWTAHNKTRWGAEFLKICAERCPEQVVESLEWEGVLGSAKRRHVTMELWQLLDKLFRRREVTTDSFPLAAAKLTELALTILRSHDWSKHQKETIAGCLSRVLERTESTSAAGTAAPAAVETFRAELDAAGKKNSKLYMLVAQMAKRLSAPVVVQDGGKSSAKAIPSGQEGEGRGGKKSKKRAREDAAAEDASAEDSLKPVEQGVKEALGVVSETGNIETGGNLNKSTGDGERKKKKKRKI